MKRFHIHSHVADLEADIGSDSKLFATEVTRVEGDHAKWMLDDPRIDLTICIGGSQLGVGRLGSQMDTEEERVALKAQAEAEAEAEDTTLQDAGETTRAMHAA